MLVIFFKVSVSLVYTSYICFLSFDTIKKKNQITACISSLKRVFNYQGAKPGFELLNLLLVAGAVQPSLHDAISGFPVSGRQALKIFFFSFTFPI